MAGYQHYRKNRGVRGYSTVFLLIIMAAYTSAVIALTDAAAGYAATSISENVCAVAGRSVLSEYQNELFRRYGLFLLRNAEDLFEKKADFYILSSLTATKGIVKFRMAVADIDMAMYPGTSIPELKRQIGKLAIGVNEYILGYFSMYTETLPDTYRKYEVEDIICGGENDEENLALIKTRLTAFRFAVNIATLNKEDIDVSALGTFIEAVIPGHIDDAAVEVTQAYEQAERDAADIMNGGIVPIFSAAQEFGKYKDYMRIFLAFVPENLKFARMMSVMETNIRMVDAVLFSFCDYVYGFDMKVMVSRRPLLSFPGINTGQKYVWQHFAYR